MEKIVYDIDTSNGKKAIVTDDLHSGRINMINSVPRDKQMDSDVTIMVQAYNRIEKTKECIKSILDNTKGVNYDLLLIDNGSTDETFEYFKSIDHDKVRIIHLNKNVSASYPIFFYDQTWISEYFVVLGNDIVVTPNWLNNLIRIFESDEKIGMIVPVSSNTSNLQVVDLKFSNSDEMQKKAAAYNISDPSKWHERLRLVTPCALYRKECIYALGWPMNDVGFFHDFVDDDITFRVRRAGYKAILAKDTWVHHNHDIYHLENKDPVEFQKSLDIGKENFRSKYFGVDAWDDVNNYIPEILPRLKPPEDKDNCFILGVDVKCGTPILEIKNHIRSFGVFDPVCSALTFDGKYFIDLQTVCGSENVFACSPENAFGYLPPEVFDYIIIGSCINEYPEPVKVLKSVYSLLKKGGQMFIYLRNLYDIFTFLNVIGHRNVQPKTFAYNMTLESFAAMLNDMNMPYEIVGAVPYETIPSKYLDEGNKRSAAFVRECWDETNIRLTAEKFAILITKK